MPIYSKENTVTVSGLSCKIHRVANLGSGDIPSNAVLLVEEDTGIIKSALNSFIAISRAKRTTFLLLSDMFILTERSERLIRSMVYGRIQFITEYVGSRINRYINIHKIQGNPPNKMIPFNVTARGITIDARERVG